MPIISEKYVPVISNKYVTIVSDKYVSIISDRRRLKNIVSAQNPPEVTLHCNSHSSGPIKATKVPGVPFER